MTLKQRLAHIAIGGVLVAFGMIISPLNAQKDKFGEIECTKLTVVDETGTVITLTSKEQGGAVYVYGKYTLKPLLILTADEDGGSVSAYGQNGQNAVYLGADADGGSVSTYGQDGQTGVRLGSNTDGGSVNVYCDGIEWLGLYAKTHARGGAIGVSGKDGKTRCLLGVTESGDGTLGLWNNNGYLQK